MCLLHLSIENNERHMRSIYWIVIQSTYIGFANQPFLLSSSIAHSGHCQPSGKIDYTTLLRNASMKTKQKFNENKTSISFRYSYIFK